LGQPERAAAETSPRVDLSTRLQHVYIVGQTGTGKSTLMLHMALQDIEEGRGVTVLDPHGPLIEQLLDRIPARRRDDVILLDPADAEWCTGVNPLAISTDDPIQYVAERDRVIDELLDTFDVLYDLRVTGGPMFEQCFRTFLGVIVGTRRPDSYIPILPMLAVAMNSKALSRVLASRAAADDPVLVTTLETILDATGEAQLSAMAPYITSKLIRFYGPASARRILCQTRSLDFQSIIESRKILLAELPKTRLGAEAAALLARQIIVRLGQAAMSRRPGAEPSPHLIYADEFHTFATERFATLLSEARKFGLGLTLAHQYTSQLVTDRGRKVLDAVLGNAGTMVLFRVGLDDARLLDAAVAPRAGAHDIAGLPNFMAIVRSVGLSGVPFTLRTLPPPAIPQTADAGFRQRAARRFARPHTEVDVEINAQIEALKKASKRVARESTEEAS
jgi:type IV secretory pathway TraG/TraD family ATPase VirD4